MIPDKISEIALAAKKKSLAEKQKAKIKVPASVKCDCGHLAKDHYQGSGWCHHSKHPNAGGCSCTWYYPNYKWCMKQKLKSILALPERQRDRQLKKAMDEYEQTGIKLTLAWKKVKMELMN